MTYPALPVDDPAPADWQRPPMPSIAASALQESLLLVAATSRAVAAWLARG
jgi:hypothetical protein